MGVSPSNQLISVEEHRHEVELDITRIELGLSRTLDANWDVGVRLPYFIKDQTAEVKFPANGSAAGRDAAIRNGRIHHRDEVYDGFGDVELSIGWRTRDWLIEGSAFRFAFGTTLPFGDTEEDPWGLGDAGLEHLHVQFGNGTFDPIAEFYWGVPINQHLGASLFGKARLPFYRNSKGYTGAPEITLAPRLTWLVNKQVSVTGGVIGQYLGYSEWKETGRDENSGQLTVLGSIGIGYKFSERLTASVTALLPMYSESYGIEDALDPAPTFSLSIGTTF